MFHSVTINGKNTWDDYHMVPADGIILPPPPEQKRMEIDLKTANGKLDISTLLTGYPIFNNRNGSMKFWLLEPYDYDSYAEVGSSDNPYDRPSAYQVYSQLLNDIHATTGTMTFEDDPDWFYQGKFTIDTFTTEEMRRGVTIKYDVAPYKYSVEEYTQTLAGAGTNIWSYSGDLNADIFGSAPINPTVQVTGEFAVGDQVQVQILKYPYTSSGIIKTIEDNDPHQWADFLVYRRAKLCVKADSGKSVTWRFRQGRL